VLRMIEAVDRSLLDRGTPVSIPFAQALNGNGRGCLRPLQPARSRA
jgi:hypothetical protein